MGRPSRTGGSPPIERLALSRIDAARLITVSPREFDQLVTSGDMPSPRRIGGLDRWLRKDIEDALSAMPECGPSKKMTVYTDVA